MPYDYRKSERLRKNTEFVATMKGKRLSTDGLSLFYRQNGSGNFRVGISVGKKVGNAVRRNRLRRQLRSCIGKVLRDQAGGYDLGVVARQELAGREFGDILKAVIRAFQQSRVLGTDPKGSTR